MERSPDVAAATERLYEAMSTGDAETAMSLLSSADGALLIGTDPGEWLTDHDEMRALFAAQTGAGVKVRSGGDMQAYEEGSIGWVADQAAFVLPDGSEVPFRMTAVWRRHDGDWKIIQSHASIAMPNEDAGMEL